MIPINKYDSLSREGLIELLIKELQSYKHGQCDQDELNDIQSVRIERSELNIVISAWRYLIDVEKILLVEDINNRAISEESYLPFIAK